MDFSVLANRRAGTGLRSHSHVPRLPGQTGVVVVFHRVLRFCGHDATDFASVEAPFSQRPVAVGWAGTLQHED